MNQNQNMNLNANSNDNESQQTSNNTVNGNAMTNISPHIQQLALQQMADMNPSLQEYKNYQQQQQQQQSQPHGAPPNTFHEDQDPSDLDNTNLYIKGLWRDCTQVELDDLFKQFGVISQSRVYGDGVGFVRFEQGYAAKAAIATMDKQKVDRCPDQLLVKYAFKKQRNSKRYIREVEMIMNKNTNNVYLRCLPHGFCEKDLTDLCGQFGELTCTRLRESGVAFVRYRKAEDAQNAIRQMNGQTFPNHNEKLLAKLANSDPFQPKIGFKQRPFDEEDMSSIPESSHTMTPSQGPPDTNTPYNNPQQTGSNQPMGSNRQNRPQHSRQNRQQQQPSRGHNKRNPHQMNQYQPQQPQQPNARYNNATSYDNNQAQMTQPPQYSAPDPYRAQPYAPQEPQPQQQQQQQSYIIYEQQPPPQPQAQAQPPQHFVYSNPPRNAYGHNPYSDPNGTFVVATPVTPNAYNHPQIQTQSQPVNPNQPQPQQPQQYNTYYTQQYPPSYNQYPYQQPYVQQQQQQQQQHQQIVSNQPVITTPSQPGIQTQTPFSPRGVTTANPVSNLTLFSPRATNAIPNLTPFSPRGVATTTQTLFSPRGVVSNPIANLTPFSPRGVVTAPTTATLSNATPFSPRGVVTAPTTNTLLSNAAITIVSPNVSNSLQPGGSLQPGAFTPSSSIQQLPHSLSLAPDYIPSTATSNQTDAKTQPQTAEPSANAVVKTLQPPPQPNISTVSNISGVSGASGLSATSLNTEQMKALSFKAPTINVPAMATNYVTPMGALSPGGSEVSSIAHAVSDMIAQAGSINPLLPSKVATASRSLIPITPEPTKKPIMSPFANLGPVRQMGALYAANNLNSNNNNNQKNTTSWHTAMSLVSPNQVPPPNTANNNNNNAAESGVQSDNQSESAILNSDKKQIESASNNNKKSSEEGVVQAAAPGTSKANPYNVSEEWANKLYQAICVWYPKQSPKLTGMFLANHDEQRVKKYLNSQDRLKKKIDTFAKLLSNQTLNNPSK